MKPGIEREMVVERPQKGTEQIWRAYVGYATEMQGPPLWKAQLREAWKIRSFANWTGKAWGGGRFSGRNEFLSEEFAEGVIRTKLPSPLTLSRPTGEGTG
jgi:hypothetical protein